MNSKKSFLFQILIVEACIVAVNLLFVILFFNSDSNNKQEPYIVEEYPVINMTFNSTGRYIETTYQVSDDATETLNFFRYSVDNIDNSTVEIYSDGQARLTISLLDTD